MRKKYNEQPSRLIDVEDLPPARPILQNRTFDRPYSLSCDTDTLDENGDVLVSIHLLPRSVQEGMQIIFTRIQGQPGGEVVDVDRHYGLVAIRINH